MSDPENPEVPTMRRPWKRRLAAAALAAATACGIAACGSAQAGPPRLTWYINPDSGGQAEIARRCTDAAGGRYSIDVAQLPRESSAQREQLVRRLAANDSSIDIMSLDPPYIPEFSEARLLAPMPPDLAARVTEGVVESAVKGASWRGQVVTVPFWANTQLLWYRRSTVAGTGLDLSQPVTWDQLIAAAQAKGSQFAVQGKRAEALTVWLNALVSSAGGAIITNPSVDDPEGVQLGLGDPPATEAGRIMKELTDAGVGGPSLSTAGEDANVTAFENGDALFMVNWPFVWPRANESAAEGTLGADVPADYGWALYPRVEPDRPSAPPYGGINLGVGAFSRHPDLAYEATECITSAANQTYYFVENGNPAARESVYSDPSVLQAFPMAPVILQSLEQAAPRPQTAYYSEVSQSVQREYHPTSRIDPAATGAATAALIQEVLAKKELL